MIISTILSRETIVPDSKINIIWTDTNNSFKEFIQSLGHNLIDFNELYYGYNVPQLILCNNKTEYYNECYNLSIKLHLPIVIVDHEVKNKFLDINKIHDLNFPCYHHVCLSENIKQSWGAIDAQVISYDINNTESKKIWQNLIFQAAKKLYLR
jgi:hypothetical protein